mmetsp:Transcript_20423/g.43797  ORF Transcript_20423/g.43797 Transcript_20423/m.43797 type:complete len:702 (+) Transcript_20423:58-2163(+)
MNRKKINEDDDVSTLSEGGRGFFSSSRARTAPRNRSGSRPRNTSLSLSQSVPSGSATSSGGGGGLLRKLRGSIRRSAANPDDVSVSDSMCSSDLRGEFDVASGVGNSFTGGGAAVNTRSSTGTTDMGTGNRFAGVSIGNMSGRSSKSIGATTAAPPLPGGVADFNQNFNQNVNRKPSNEHSLTSSGTGPSMSNMSQPLLDDPLRREQRKERVKEKLDRYKRDQRELRQSCAALEQQLAQTTEKLKEIDSKAVVKIGSLESELRETLGGIEHAEKQSTEYANDQGKVIRTLGKKLIRQSHIIKRQKATMEQYKVDLGELRGEMAAQGERESRRAEEYCQLKDEHDGTLEEKLQIQAMLHETMKETMDMKSEAERGAKSTMELKFKFDQKEAALARVTKDVAERKVKIRTLELELEEKGIELDDMVQKLKTTKKSVEQMKKILESANQEVEDLQTKCTALEMANEEGRGGEGEDVDAPPALPHDLSPSVTWGGAATVDARATRSPSLLGWNWARDSAMDVETFEAELQAKDATIQNLNDTATEHEETIQSLRSDMVKMSSTFKQDSYLKRKEIAKLKQMNAEYALKLRALEKAFKSVGGIGVDIANSMHGLTSSARSPSSSNSGLSLSLHGKSMYSQGDRNPASVGEVKTAAVESRQGPAPYEFPSADQLRKTESKLVVVSNLFDGSDHESEEGRKGDSLEEC